MSEKGGLWSAYLARQARTERLCTLTVFHLDPGTDPWARFRRELEQLSPLRHPSLVEVLDLGVAHDGTPYLVTELLAGEHLGARLRKRGALTLPEALAVARQIGAALCAAHGVGVLHRDVRPENVYLSEEGEGAASFLRAKLFGVGVAQLLEGTISGMALFGNPEYMAPEQVLGHSTQVDSRADHYALAVLLYQALTTSRPFHGDSIAATLIQVTRGEVEPLRALLPDLPQNVEAAITRAMHLDRESRFPDLPAFLQALQQGVPLPVGMAELTEPWLSPPPDLEEARRLVLATGAEPAAPLSLGVSAALELAARSLPTVLGGIQEAAEPLPEAGGGAGVPQPFNDAVATVPHSMQDVMQLAVPEPRAPEPVPAGAEADSTLRNPGAALDARAEEDPSTSLEIIAEYNDDGRPVPLAGETEVVTRRHEHDQLPSIIVDLPTRPISDGDRLPRGVAAPNDATRLSAHDPGQFGEPRPLLQQLGELLERRAPLAERLAWALGGACAGGLLMRLLG